ncbi:hypothetical protein ACFFLM_03370 [Deinococcus oregonensis]|uniref:Uncharacterized protein n=1 Tax=Deinococcus oregonensis TaxID=1805970 RepID=A0ABV6AU36_9DEIO
MSSTARDQGELGPVSTSRFRAAQQASSGADGGRRVAQQFGRSDFVTTVHDACQRHQLDPSARELTERGVL